MHTDRPAGGFPHGVESVPPVGDRESDNLAFMARSDAVTLFLVRHGQAGGNGTVDGFIGPALSECGERQAQLVAARFAALPLKLDHIYCSDMARSSQTAEAVGRLCPDTPLSVLPELREISALHGNVADHPETAEVAVRLREERDRAIRFAARLRGLHTRGQVVAVVAHNGFNGMLVAELAGVAYRTTVRLVSCHTGVSVVSLSDAVPNTVVRLMGCTRHLPAELVTDINAVIIPQE